jgi:hypothetical protein
MKSKELLALAVLMTLSFVATCAVVWMQRPADTPPPVAAAPRGPSPPPPADVRASPPAPPPPSRTPPAPPAAIEVPPPDYSGPPLPVLFAISSHPATRRADDDAGVGDGLRRQVDIANNSGELLEITILAVDTPTQQTSSAQVLLPPHGQAHAGSETGLKLEPGEQIALRSSGYQELTATVP